MKCWSGNTPTIKKYVTSLPYAQLAMCTIFDSGISLARPGRLSLRFPRDGLGTRLVLAPFINITHAHMNNTNNMCKEQQSTVYTLPISHPIMWLLRRGGIPNGGQYGRQRGEQCGLEGGRLTHQLLGQLYQPVATQKRVHYECHHVLSESSQLI